MAQTVKNLPAMQETRVQSLGQENPLKKGMATHSCILAWRIPWTEEFGGLQSMRSQRVRHDWAAKHTHIYRFSLWNQTILNTNVTNSTHTQITVHDLSLCSFIFYLPIAQQKLLYSTLLFFLHSPVLFRLKEMMYIPATKKSQKIISFESKKCEIRKGRDHIS